MKSIFVLCAVVLLLIPSGPHAGEVRVTTPAPIGKAVYQILAVIEDDAGSLVSGLTADRFSISVDRIETTAREVFPVTDQWAAVALLIDKSGSMKGKPLDAAKRAAVDFVQRCSHQTLFAVIPFDDSPLPEPEFKRREQGVTSRISSIESGKDTSLNDAILTTIPYLEKYWPPVKAMIALTDGKDTKSKISYEGLLASLNGCSIPVYTVGLGRDLEEDRLDSLAHITGGSYFHAPAPDDLVEVYRAIASELDQGYVVRFDLPTNLAETGTHVLELTVVSDGDTMIGTHLFDMTGDSHGAETPHMDSGLSVETRPEQQIRKGVQFPSAPVLLGAGIALVIGAGLLLLMGRGERGSRLWFAFLITLLGALLGGLYWINV